MQNNFATTAQTFVNNCAKFCQQSLKTDGVINCHFLVLKIIICNAMSKEVALLSQRSRAMRHACQ